MCEQGVGRRHDTKRRRVEEKRANNHEEKRRHAFPETEKLLTDRFDLAIDLRYAASLVIFLRFVMRQISHSSMSVQISLSRSRFLRFWLLVADVLRSASRTPPSIRP